MRSFAGLLLLWFLRSRSRKRRNSEAIESSRTAEYRIVYDESVRQLTSQESSLATLRARAGTLIAAASLATAFLAPPALEVTDTAGHVTRHFDTWAKAATGCFAGVLFLALLLLFPYSGWIFGNDPHSLLDDHVEPATGAPSDEATLLRDIAYYNGINFDANSKRLKWLYRAFGAGTLLLIAEIFLWLGALA